MKSVVILGTGMTLSKFNIKEHSGSEIWAVGSAFNILKNKDIKIDKYFCLHKNETLDFDGEIIKQEDYPLDKIIEKYKTRYFTNSISYMIAFALYNNFKDIKLYGVDMDSDSEYIFERPSVSYWIGFARGLSVEVYIASEIDNPIFLYGFDDTSSLLQKFRDRRVYSANMANVCLINGDTRRSDQYAGQCNDLDYWIREIRG